MPRNDEQYRRVMFHGQPVTIRQRQALVAVELDLGMEFVVPQGSWQPQTTYSGRTHTGAGVVDLWLPRMDDERWFRHALNTVKNVGRQAAFGRGPLDGMPYHFHVCDLDTAGMSTDAAWQVAQWRERNNGLSNGAPDRYPHRPEPVRKWRYRA